MAYSTIRVRGLHFSDLDAAYKHNSREYGKDEQCPANIDRSKTRQNIGFALKTFIQHKKTTGGLASFVHKRCEELGVKGKRKDSRYAIEFVVGCSDRSMIDQMLKIDSKDQKSKDLKLRRYFNKWISEKYGCEPISSDIHLDESNPHIHIIAMLTKKKKVTRKNRYGSSTNEEVRLCVGDVIDGADKLSKMQQDYFDWLVEYQKNYAKDHPNYIPVDLYRGTKAERELKQYTEKTNYRIGQIRTAIQECQSAASAKALEAEIEAIRDETKAELNRLEKEAEKARMGAIPPEWKAQGHPEDQPRRPHRRGR